MAQAAKLSIQRVRHLSRRWGEALTKRKDAHDPVFTPWFALASLPADGFGPKAADLIRSWWQSPDLMCLTRKLSCLMWRL